jgi:hypothetical protein
MGFGVSVCLERHVGSWAKDGTSEFVGRGFFAGSETIRSRAISYSSRQQARQSMARARLSGQVRLLYWNERERERAPGCRRWYCKVATVLALALLL